MDPSDDLDSDLSAASRRPWWRAGRYEIGEGVCFQIGPLGLWARRLAKEWRLAVAVGDDPLASRLETTPSTSDTPPEGFDLRRYGFRTSPDLIRLRPLLADRPLVVGPEAPFLLPPGEETTVYVSMPVWVVVEVGGPHTPLLETPSHRLSDTWFGPTTREGELCYSLRTSARLTLDALPIRPHRAIAVTRIHNRATTVLEVDRFTLPAPNMSLFVDSSGGLWTEPVDLVREHDGTHADVRLAVGAPSEATAATRLGGPRREGGSNLLQRAFGGLIRELRG
jgi:hypothetical protein